jgi:hypothetical protein
MCSYADLPVGKDALAYLNRIKSGESILDNYFPFWAAALLDRYLLFVVPIVLAPAAHAQPQPAALSVLHPQQHHALVSHRAPGRAARQHRRQL